MSKPTTTAERWLVKMNSKHFVLTDGGKTTIGEWVKHPDLGIDTLSRTSRRDFICRYENQTVKRPSRKGGKNETVDLGTAWVQHPERLEYKGLALVPNGVVENGYLNLWRGFGMKARRGKWPLLHGHILYVLCNGNEDHAEYFLNWVAFLIQHPEKQNEVAVVLQGSKGSGKGVIGRLLLKFFGEHALHVTQEAHIIGRFNAHLRHCVFVFADEAFFPGDRRHDRVLKGLITEPELMIEEKFMAPQMMGNRLSFLIASNETQVIRATGPDERRYFVLELSDGRVKDQRYFNALINEIENGGAAAFSHAMQTRDLSGVDIRDVPFTEALAVQAAMNLSPAEEFLHLMLSRGSVPGAFVRNYAAPDSGALVIEKKAMTTAFRYWANSIKRVAQEVRGAEQVLWMRAHKLLRTSLSTPSDRAVARQALFVTLEECRKEFSKNMRIPFDWDAPYEWVK